MTAHPLDRPVWAALTTRQAHVARGGARARAYLPGIIPFAASAGDDDDDSLAALVDLIGPEETLMLIQAAPIRLPPGLVAVARGRGVQMLPERPMERASPPSGVVIEKLSAADAQAMLDLATLTNPARSRCAPANSARFGA